MVICPENSDKFKVADKRSSFRELWKKKVQMDKKGEVDANPKLLKLHPNYPSNNNSQQTLVKSLHSEFDYETCILDRPPPPLLFRCQEDLNDNMHLSAAHFPNALPSPTGASINNINNNCLLNDYFRIKPINVVRKPDETGSHNNFHRFGSSQRQHWQVIEGTQPTCVDPSFEEASNISKSECSRFEYSSNFEAPNDNTSPLSSTHSHFPSSFVSPSTKHPDILSHRSISGNNNDIVVYQKFTPNDTQIVEPTNLQLLGSSSTVHDTTSAHKDFQPFLSSCYTSPNRSIAQVLLSFLLLPILIIFRYGRDVSSVKLNVLKSKQLSHISRNCAQTFSLLCFRPLIHLLLSFIVTTIRFMRSLYNKSSLRLPYLLNANTIVKHVRSRVHSITPALLFNFLQSRLTVLFNSSLVIHSLHTHLSHLPVMVPFVSLLSTSTTPKLFRIFVKHRATTKLKQKYSPPSSTTCSSYLPGLLTFVLLFFSLHPTHFARVSADPVGTNTAHKTNSLLPDTNEPMSQDDASLLHKARKFHEHNNNRPVDYIDPESYDSNHVYIPRFVVEFRPDTEYAVDHPHHLIKRYVNQHPVDLITSFDKYHVIEHKYMPQSKFPFQTSNKTFLTSSDIVSFDQQRSKNRVKRYRSSELLSSFNDPSFQHQWYLHRTGRDLNIDGAWRLNYMGRGVTISILDDGIEKDHPELSANYDPDASYDINGEDNDPQPRYDISNENRHGTRCAGEVAAVANNSICIVGVAFKSKIGGVRMLDGDVTDEVEARALSLNPNHIDIYSASWGPDDDGKTLDGPARLAQKAFENGVTYGRRGLGSIFVWASGNGGRDSDNCNCDGYTNSRYTLSISSATESGHVPWYSEPCSSTLATTYSSGSVMEHKIVSSDLRHECTESHTGTSASAPLAAGILALTLEANPNLGWRDMQHLVVATSNPNNLYVNDWLVNGVGRKVSHSFGYGMMDAGAMVKAARVWRNVPPANNCTVINIRHSGTIPPNGSIRFSLETDGCLGQTAGGGGTSYNDIVKNRNFYGFQSGPDGDEPIDVYSYGNHVKYLEHVQARITLKAPERGQIEIFLTSPAGTTSKLLFRRPKDFSGAGIPGWPFMSTHSWGELSYGTWTLEITNKANVPGYLVEWSLILHGTETQPETLAALSSAAAAGPSSIRGLRPGFGNPAVGQNADGVYDILGNGEQTYQGDQSSISSGASLLSTGGGVPILQDAETNTGIDSSSKKFTAIRNCFKMLAPGHCLVCDDSFALYEGMCLKECPPNLYKSHIMTPPIVFPSSISNAVNRKFSRGHKRNSRAAKRDQEPVLATKKEVDETTTVKLIEATTWLRERDDNNQSIVEITTIRQLALRESHHDSNVTQTIEATTIVQSTKPAKKHGDIKEQENVEEAATTATSIPVIRNAISSLKKKQAKAPKKKVIKKLFTLVCKTCHRTCKRCKDGGRTHCTECHDGYYLAPLIDVRKNGDSRKRFHRRDEDYSKRAATSQHSRKQEQHQKHRGNEDIEDFSKFMQSQEEEEIYTGAVCRACHSTCRTCKGSRETDCTSCPKTLPTPPFPVLTIDGRCVFPHTHGHVRSESDARSPENFYDFPGFAGGGSDLLNNNKDLLSKGLNGISHQPTRFLVVVISSGVMIAFFVAFFFVTKNLGQNRPTSSAGNYLRRNIMRRFDHDEDNFGNASANIENLEFRVRRDTSAAPSVVNDRSKSKSFLAGGIKGDESERHRLNSASPHKSHFTQDANSYDPYTTKTRSGKSILGNGDLNIFKHPPALFDHVLNFVRIFTPSSGIPGGKRSAKSLDISKMMGSHSSNTTTNSATNHAAVKNQYKLVPLYPLSEDEDTTSNENDTLNTNILTRDDNVLDLENDEHPTDIELFTRRQSSVTPNSKNAVANKPKLNGTKNPAYRPTQNSDNSDDDDIASLDFKLNLLSSATAKTNGPNNRLVLT